LGVEPDGVQARYQLALADMTRSLDDVGYRDSRARAQDMQRLLERVRGAA
jgi:hypothetical protein